jgi:uncharacterized protein (DUF2461 family)
MPIEPGESFAGGGVYMPDSAALTRIRDGIVADTRGWKRLVENGDFGPAFKPMGEALKRAPRASRPLKTAC